jgi:hypothetical protein
MPMHDSETDPTDQEIEGLLQGASQYRWVALWAAVDQVEAETEHVTWGGGQQVDTTVVDGVERPLLQMPYAIFSDALERLIRSLYELGVIVSFNWPDWHGDKTYARGRGLDTAPVADAVRMVTAIVRADRFSEGTIAAMLDDGTLLAALGRIRHWYEVERSPSSIGAARLPSAAIASPSSSEPSAQVMSAGVATGSSPHSLALEALVNAWQRLTPDGPRRAAVDAGAWPDVLAGMAVARDRVVATGGWTAGPSTLMGVLDLARAEVQHCRVVRWLLDPLARHGIGAPLLAELCRHLDATLPEPTLARTTAEVSRATSRADLVIEGLAGGRVIVVEAKIDAAEGDLQAHRLEADWPEAEHLVFLTVPGTRIPATATDIPRWQALSWAWVADRVTELLASTPEPPDDRAIDARRAATDWVAGVRRYLR